MCVCVCVCVCMSTYVCDCVCVPVNDYSSSELLHDIKHYNYQQGLFTKDTLRESIDMPS